MADDEWYRIPHHDHWIRFADFLDPIGGTPRSDYHLQIRLDILPVFEHGDRKPYEFIWLLTGNISSAYRTVDGIYSASKKHMNS